MNCVDLGRMYLLVSRTEKGMVELRDRFEKHVLTQGTASVERYHETAVNVSHTQVTFHNIRISELCKF